MEALHTGGNADVLARPLGGSRLSVEERQKCAREPKRAREDSNV
jgi:hypothetical protein